MEGAKTVFTVLNNKIKQNLGKYLLHFINKISLEKYVLHFHAFSHTSLSSLNNETTVLQIRKQPKVPNFGMRLWSFKKCHFYDENFIKVAGYLSGSLSE